MKEELGIHAYTFMHARKCIHARCCVSLCVLASQADSGTESIAGGGWQTSLYLVSKDLIRKSTNLATISLIRALDTENSSLL